MDPILAVLAGLGALVVLDVLALRHGATSRDGKREVWW